MTIYDARLLPNLILIGANKAGTTSFHSYLGQHPEVFMCTPKEPMFFATWGKEPPRAVDPRSSPNATYFFSTVESYQRLFEKGRDAKVRGESSTTYLANPACAPRIRELVPEARILAILRNPVDRAFSNWSMYRFWRHEKMTFESAVEEELATGRTSYPEGMRYLSLGFYTGPLRCYLDAFPGPQSKIVLYDDLNRQPYAVYADVCRFLGIDSNFVPDMERHLHVSSLERFPRWSILNRGLSLTERVARKLALSGAEKQIRRVRLERPQLAMSTRRRLTDYYRSEVTALESLIDRDLSAWKC